MSGALRLFRWPRRWLVLWALMIAMVVVGSLLPTDALPPSPFDQFDKLEHFLGYAALSAYAVLLFASRRAQVAAAIGLVALGVGLEFAQAVLTESRRADVFDALADASGVLAGLLLAATSWALALQWLDARLAK
jgi:VanZ family protein